MQTIKKTIIIILLFAANIIQAQKLVPLLDYCNRSKNTAKKNSIAVKQIRQVRGDGTDFVCEYFTIVCNYDKNDSYFCVVDTAFMNIVKITKNNYISVNNRTHELANYDKNSEQYQLYRLDKENQIYCLNYYQFPIPKLVPYDPFPVTNKSDSTIRNTPCVMYVAERTCDYYDSRGKTKLGTRHDKKIVYINKTSGDVDSLIYYKTYSDGIKFINKEYITNVSDYDFNALTNQLNFDNPKYSNYSRHNAENPPYSTQGSNNIEINSFILNYPITNLKGEVTNLADMKGWILFDFWQFGCRACFAQFKQFAHERDSLGSTILEQEGVRILSIHPYSDNMEMIGQIGNKYHISAYLYSAKGLNEHLQMYSYPTYYLISPDKKVALKTNYLGDYSEILNIIKNYK